MPNSNRRLRPAGLGLQMCIAARPSLMGREGVPWASAVVFRLPPSLGTSARVNITGTVRQVCASRHP